jgi:hypothetical protein
LKKINAFLTSIKIRVHAFSQLHLILFNLLSVVSEDTVDDEESIEHGPLALVSLEVFDFRLVIIATGLILQAAKIAIATESFKALFASQTRNYITLCQINWK